MFLNPSESMEDYEKLRQLVNEKENVFLDCLQDAYPLSQDSGGNSDIFHRSLNMKMLKEFMSKHDIAKLNEFFALLRENHRKVGFSDEQQRQIATR